MATVAAVAVLITTLWVPVLRVFGSSMTPTLYEGNVVITVKTSSLKPGDVIAFYYNNSVLVKRLIGMPGDWIDIDEEGNVYLNGELLDEPYVDQKALGECNIELPCQVPENRVFVLGDHRSVSIDSRNTSIGFIPKEQLVGRIALRIWPLSGIEKVK
ncbi:MAG: signal peptidase I [Eubacterium sp.]|nr:signal peptidase I [Eubacterium sp.]